MRGKCFCNHIFNLSNINTNTQYSLFEVDNYNCVHVICEVSCIRNVQKSMEKPNGEEAEQKLTTPGIIEVSEPPEPEDCVPPPHHFQTLLK